MSKKKKKKPSKEERAFWKSYDKACEKKKSPKRRIVEKAKNIVRLSFGRVQALVKGLFDGIDDEGLLRAHRADIRASSLPFCDMDVALTHWSKEGSGIQPKERWQIGNLLFVSIGTAVHEAMQAYFGYTGVLYGSWECRVCEKTWVNQMSPGKCCGQMTDYIEFSLVHTDPRFGRRGDGEFGHCDGIIPLPDGNGYLILEIKTTGESMVKVVRSKGAFPKHRAQASVYYDMFKEGYARVIHRGRPTPEHPEGKTIFDVPGIMPPGGPQGILFIYVLRDKPRMKYWTMLVHKPLKDTLKNLEKQIPRILNDRTNPGDDLPSMKCKTKADATNEFGTTCPWRGICFSPSKESAVKDIRKTYLKHLKRLKKGKKA